MLQSLIDDFDSLDLGMQKSLGDLIHGMAVKQAVERSQINLARKSGVLPFDVFSNRLKARNNS